MQLTAKQEFLKANGIATVQDLSDELLLRFFLEGHGGITNKLSSLSIGTFGIQKDYNLDNRNNNPDIDQIKQSLCFFLKKSQFFKSFSLILRHIGKETAK